MVKLALSEWLTVLEQYTVISLWEKPGLLQRNIFLYQV